MLAFTVRRALQGIFVILGVVIVTFLAARVAPSDPASLYAGDRATPQQRAQAVRELGLDRPVYVQLEKYMLNLAHGDLGRSLQSKQPVAKEIGRYLPPTIELVLAAMLLAVLIGVPLGVLSADKKDRWPDHASRIFSVGVVSMPTFWVALLLQLVFYRKLGLLPIDGQLSAEVTLFSPVHHVTGMMLVDALITGNAVALGNAAVHLILPAIALCGAPLGLVARMTRSAMVEITNEDYITAANSYGLRKRLVLWRYAFSNSLGPTATVVALAIGYLLVNTFLVEALFSWPGIGSYIVTAVVTLDYPAILAVTIVSAIAYVILNLIADLVVALDPRVRASS